MEIRHTTEADLPRIMEIYEAARNFMAAHGNPNQWGPSNWPPEALIRSDISCGSSYVCIHEGRIVGTFFYTYGEKVERDYLRIEGGSWQGDDTYGVVHRIAGDGSVKGIGEFCLNWAFRQCRHLRIDTHSDNLVMQNLLHKLGFIHCGTIYLEKNNDPRLAFEKISG